MLWSTMPQADEISKGASREICDCLLLDNMESKMVSLERYEGIILIQMIIRVNVLVESSLTTT